MPVPAGDQYPTTRCGEHIGRGTVAYPCGLEAGHSGPHAAVEIPSTMTMRQAWVEEQAELNQVAPIDATTPPTPAPAPAPAPAAQPAPEAPAAAPAQAAPEEQAPQPPPVKSVDDGISPVLPGFGEDLRSLVKGLNSRLDQLVNQKKLTERDGVWMLEASQTLRDLFEPSWRDHS